MSSGPHPDAPLFVVTHEAPASAGSKWVSILGASVAQQALRTGLVDEIQLHVAPIVLGAGIRLFDEGAQPFELLATRVVAGPNATHLRYRVEAPATSVR